MKRVLSLFVILLLVLSGCTHWVDSKLYLNNFNGSGHQIIRVQINKADVPYELSKIRDDIMPVIEAADPLDDSKLTNSIENGNVLVITYEFTFENFNEYQLKVGKLTGKSNMFISAIEGEDPFLNSVSMQGFVVDPTAYMQWAIKAIEDAKIYGTGDLNVYTKRDTSVYSFGGSDLIALDDFGIVIDKIVNLTTLDISTSIAADQTLTREITFAVDPTQIYGKEIIDNGWAVTMMNEKIDALTSLLSPSVTAETKEGLYLIKVSFSSLDPVKITEATNSLIPGLESTLSFSLKDGTKILEWNETFAQVMRGYADILDNPIHYQVSLKGYDLKTVDGVAYDKATTYPFEVVNKTLSLSSDAFSLKVGIQKSDNTNLYLLIGGGIAFVVVAGVIVLLLKKKRPKVVKASVETPLV